MKFQRWLILVMLLPLVQACSFSLKKAGLEETTDSDAVPASAAGGVDYATIRKQLLEPKCLSCHTTRAPILATYDQVKANLSGIEATVLVDQSMPPSGPVSGSLQTTLRSWIEAGAPEVVESAEAPVTAPTSVPTVEPVPAELVGIERPVRFSVLQREVLKDRCNNCHFEGAVDDFGDPLTPYETYGEFLSSEGTIFHVVFKARRMPKPEAQQLSNRESAMFILWYADGLLE